MEDEKKKGRPTKFNERLKEKMVQLYEQGKTDEEVAEIIGVSPRTIYNWKGKHEDFLQALRESKQIADELVEASYFSRAVGYSHPEEKLFQYEGEVIRAETTKHYPPDPGAAANWLANRQPDVWRKNQNESVDLNINLTNLTDEELDDRINELKEQLGNDEQ